MNDFLGLVIFQSAAGEMGAPEETSPLAFADISDFTGQCGYRSTSWALVGCGEQSQPPARLEAAVWLTVDESINPRHQGKSMVCLGTLGIA